VSGDTNYFVDIRAMWFGRPEGPTGSVHAAGLHSACPINTLIRMEKEMGVPKPGDLLIGVIDLFAVLVPGLIAAATAVLFATGGRMPDANAFSVAGLVIIGWVLGHVLHGIGSFLDPLVYDRFFKPQDSPEAASHNPTVPAKAAADQKPNGADTGANKGLSWNRLRIGTHKYLRKNDDLYWWAKKMTKFPPPRVGQVGTSGLPAGMYQWARAWLSTHSPKATTDLDRLEADSKLFRSLAVLFLLAIPILIVSPWLSPSTLSAASSNAHVLTEPGPVFDILRRHRNGWIILAFAGVLFSLWRYCDLRQKMIRQCYLNYVQLRSEEPTVEPPASRTVQPSPGDRNLSLRDSKSQ
jgi:hypothetical protein